MVHATTYYFPLVQRQHIPESTNQQDYRNWMGVSMLNSRRDRELSKPYWRHKFSKKYGGLLSHAKDIVESDHKYMRRFSIPKFWLVVFIRRANNTAPQSSSLGRLSVFKGATLLLETNQWEVNWFLIFVVLMYMLAQYAFSEASQKPWIWMS